MSKDFKSGVYDQILLLPDTSITTETDLEPWPARTATLKRGDTMRRVRTQTSGEWAQRMNSGDASQQLGKLLGWLAWSLRLRQWDFRDMTSVNDLVRFHDS